MRNVIGIHNATQVHIHRFLFQCDTCTYSMFWPNREIFCVRQKRTCRYIGFREAPFCKEEKTKKTTVLLFLLSMFSVCNDIQFVSAFAVCSRELNESDHRYRKKKKTPTNQQTDKSKASAMNNLCSYHIGFIVRINLTWMTVWFPFLEKEMLDICVRTILFALKMDKRSFSLQRLNCMNEKSADRIKRSTKKNEKKKTRSYTRST